MRSPTSLWPSLCFILPQNNLTPCFLFNSLRWSCVTLVLPVSSARSLSVALWLAPLPTWPPRFCWTRATTVHLTCGLWVSSCTSAWVGHSRLMRTKISTTRSTTQPSCTPPTPGNRSPVMVNTEGEGWEEFNCETHPERWKLMRMFWNMNC